ncbi:MAG: hypothetical protein V7K97_25145 [Nostoc sp.]
MAKPPPNLQFFCNILALPRHYDYDRFIIAIALPKLQAIIPS